MTLAGRLLAALWLWLAAAVAPAADEVAVPPLKARVTDLTGTLSRDQAAALETDLAHFEQGRGSQIAILLVPTTQPEPIEAYAIRVAEAWKIGRKGIDDGVIVLVAKNDRKLRIEVGRGLEGALPDAVAKRIVAEVIGPRFKAGDFYGGLNAGVARIESILAGEALPAPAAGPGGGANSQAAFDLGALFVVGLPIALVVGALFCRVMGRLGGSAVTAALAGGGFWLFGGSALLALVAAVLIFLAVILFGARGAWSSGGWSSGGGGWSSGGGGGGFSGGGGDFGGGGASGDW